MERNLETVARQRSLEAAAGIRLEKQAAFVEFWNAYQAMLRELHVRGRARRGDAAPSPDHERVADAFAQLFMARNKVALLGSLYTMYYTDQVMGDVEAMIDAVAEEAPEPRFPDSGHHVYYLMRAELAGNDLDGKDASEIVADLRVNSRLQRDIAQVLRRR